MSSKKQEIDNENVDKEQQNTEYTGLRDMLDVEDRENDDDLTKALNKSVRIVDFLMDFFLRFFSLTMNALGFIFRHAYLISVIIVFTCLIMVIL